MPKLRGSVPLSAVTAARKLDATYIRSTSAYHQHNSFVSVKTACCEWGVDFGRGGYIWDVCCVGVYFCFVVISCLTFVFSNMMCKFPILMSLKVIRARNLCCVNKTQELSLTVFVPFFHFWLLDNPVTYNWQTAYWYTFLLIVSKGPFAAHHFQLRRGIQCKRAGVMWLFDLIDSPLRQCLQSIRKKKTNKLMS